MTGSSQCWAVARLIGLIVSCVVASGEVHGQDTSGSLVESLTDRLETSQPSREPFSTSDDTRFSQVADMHGAGVKGAVSDSIRILSMQHAFRVGLSSKTRSELGGPFLKDYGSSIRMPRTWGDGDGWVINYLGHPSQGAASGWVWLQNEPGAERQKLGRSRRYWTSRGRGARMERHLQHAVRDRAVQRGVNRQRRPAPGNHGLDRLRDDAGRRVGDDRRRRRHRPAPRQVAGAAHEQRAVTRDLSLVHDAQPRDGQPRRRPLAMASHDPRSGGALDGERPPARAAQRRRRHPK